MKNKKILKKRNNKVGKTCLITLGGIIIGTSALQPIGLTDSKYVFAESIQAFSNKNLENPFNIDRTHYEFNEPGYPKGYQSFLDKVLNADTAREAWNYVNQPMRSRYTMPVKPGGIPNDDYDEFAYRDLARLPASKDRAKQVLKELIGTSALPSVNEIIEKYSKKIDSVTILMSAAGHQGLDPVNPKGIPNGVVPSLTNPNWGADIFSVSYLMLQALQEVQDELNSNTQTKTPTINPAKEGDTEVSGTGNPGDTITLTDKDGNEIGQGVVNQDGTWTIKVPELHKDDQITAEATNDVNAPSDKVSETVTGDDSHKDKTKTPTINPAKEGDTEVSGTGNPGDTITLTDKDGNEIGQGVVNQDGTWTIKVPELHKDDQITAEATNDVNAPSDKVSETVTGDDSHKDKTKTPTINPAKEGDTEVSGTGNPGDTITLTDKDGNEIGQGVVNQDGTWTIKVPELHKDDQITAEATNDVNAPSDKVSETVTGDDSHKDKTKTPTINPAKEGDTEVSGTGNPGDTITLTDKDGNEIGQGVVNQDGTWTIKVPELHKDDQITAEATNDVNAPSDKVSETVTGDDSHKDKTKTPTINPAKEGDTEVSGTGNPGDTITLTDKDGNEIGQGVVNQDGTWTIKVPELHKDDQITAEATNDVNAPSDKVSETVTGDDSHKDKTKTPTINPAKEGDTEVSGTGNPGDTITLTDKDGNEIGQGVVNQDGTWTIKVPELHKDDQITAEATNDVNAPSDKVSETVTGDDSHKDKTKTPTINPAKEGDTEVSGTGNPGDTITLTDKDGNEIGQGVVNQDGTWTIKVPELHKDDQITAEATNDVNAPSDKVSETVTGDDSHKDKTKTPTINPAKEGDTEVSGTGNPGDTITLTDKDGNEIGQGVVNQDGTWTIKVPELHKDDQITAEATNDVNAPSDKVSETVTGDDSHKDKTKTPTINPAKEGDTEVSGTGNPGDTITLTDKDGNEIGQGVVNQDGTWTIKVPELHKDDQITAEATNDVNAPSDKVSETVTGDDSHKDKTKTPTINPAKEGDTEVSGTGNPGDTITLTDKDGNEIGQGVVNQDGTWTIKVPELHKDDQITAEATNDVNAPSDKVSETVTGDDSHKDKTKTPTINPAKEGDTEVSGTGNPGDTITLTDKDGNEIGQGVVNQDGTWTIKVPELHKDDQITAEATNDVNAPSDKVSETVTGDDSHKDKTKTPTINPAKEGDTEVSGTGNPGDTITLTDKDGNEIGQGVVNQDGTWTIKVPELHKDDQITAEATNDVNAPSDKVSETVTGDDSHKDKTKTPTINPAKEGDTEVSGTGNPGDTITLTDKDGNEIGQGVVNQDGTWTIKVPELHKDDQITAEATNDVNAPSDKVSETVTGDDSHKDKTKTPTINPAKEGDTEVSGTGNPGDTITLTDKDGNEIGQGVVNQDGTWTIKVPELHKDDQITAEATNDVNAPSDKVSETVTGDDSHKDKTKTPTINPAKEGDTEVSGTGNPGDTITLTDKDGNEIGQGVVNQDGTWTIKDNKHGKLPYTGEKRNIILTVLGTIILGLSSIMFLYKKKKNKIKF